MHVYEVLKRPMITEKTTDMQDQANQFVFKVDRRANKMLVDPSSRLAGPLHSSGALEEGHCHTGAGKFHPTIRRRLEQKSGI